MCRYCVRSRGIASFSRVLVGLAVFCRRGKPKAAALAHRISPGRGPFSLERSNRRPFRGVCGRATLPNGFCDVGNLTMDAQSPSNKRDRSSVRERTKDVSNRSSPVVVRKYINLYRFMAVFMGGLKGMKGRRKTDENLMDVDLTKMWPGSGSLSDYEIIANCLDNGR